MNTGITTWPTAWAQPTRASVTPPRRFAGCARLPTLAFFVTLVRDGPIARSTANARRFPAVHQRGEAGLPTGLVLTPFAWLCASDLLVEC